MKPRGPSAASAAPAGEGRRIPIAVPSSGALFEGHFPGRPILPGVGLLDLALRALAATGAPPMLREIAALRLRRLVAPGDLLDLEVMALDPDGRNRIEVRRAAQIVANGVIMLGEPSPGASSAAPVRRPRSAVGFPALDDLLPHRPPMRLVVGIEMRLEDGLVCAVRVPERSAFTTGNFAPALVALEMAAQSAAVFEALVRLRGSGSGSPRIGYLVGARQVRFARRQVPAGRALFATIRLSGTAAPLSTYTFEVVDGSELVASGTMSTWLTATDA